MLGSQKCSEGKQGKSNKSAKLGEVGAGLNQEVREGFSAMVICGI